MPRYWGDHHPWSAILRCSSRKTFMTTLQASSSVSYSMSHVLILCLFNRYETFNTPTTTSHFRMRPTMSLCQAKTWNTTATRSLFHHVIPNALSHDINTPCDYPIVGLNLSATTMLWFLCLSAISMQMSAYFASSSSFNLCAPCFHPDIFTIRPTTIA